MGVEWTAAGQVKMKTSRARSVCHASILGLGSHSRSALRARDELGACGLDLTRKAYGETISVLVVSLLLSWWMLATVLVMDGRTVGGKVNWSCRARGRRSPVLEALGGLWPMLHPRRAVVGHGHG